MLNNTTIIKNRQGKNIAVQVSNQENLPKNAPVLIFSNSLGTDHTMWEKQIATLKDTFHIITYDTRGHGRSEVIADTTLQNLGEDVIDILDNLKIEKAYFCGISMGGITGLWLAVHYSERFNGIIVANSAAKIGTSEGWLQRAGIVEENGLADIVATTHTRWFSEDFDYKDDEVATHTIDTLGNTPPQGYANACCALASADVREDLAEISVPLLIIAGEKDPVTTVADGEFIVQHCTTASLAKINASHLSNIEQSDDFNQRVEQFIQAYL